MPLALCPAPWWASLIKKQRAASRPSICGAGSIRARPITARLPSPPQGRGIVSKRHGQAECPRRVSRALVSTMEMSPRDENPCAPVFQNHTPAEARTVLHEAIPPSFRSIGIRPLNSCLAPIPRLGSLFFYSSVSLVLQVFQVPVCFSFSPLFFFIPCYLIFSRLVLCKR